MKYIAMLAILGLCILANLSLRCIRRCPTSETVDLIAAYRVEIEAQAKREGAREALERAAQIFDEAAKQKQKLVWIPEAIAQQIRSLIEPTPVEPEVKPCVRCGSP